MTTTAVAAKYERMAHEQNQSIPHLLFTRWRSLLDVACTLDGNRWPLLCVRVQSVLKQVHTDYVYVELFRPNGFACMKYVRRREAPVATVKNDFLFYYDFFFGKNEYFHC